MVIKDFHLIGLSHDGITYLTKEIHDEFIIQMLCIEKDRFPNDGISSELPNDEYNKNLLGKAKSLFSFVNGVFGIGFNWDKSKEINKI